MRGFNNTSCGAYKFLRRKCTNECIFIPYFSYDEAPTHFGAIHKVFGASNVSKLLLQLPEQYRNEAALSITYQALARIRDPVYGSVAHIYALQQHVAILQEEIEVMKNNYWLNASIQGNLMNQQNPVSSIHSDLDHGSCNNTQILMNMDHCSFGINNHHANVQENFVQGFLNTQAYDYDLLG